MDVEENQRADKYGANVRFPPPLIPAAMVVLAYVLHRLWPLTLKSGSTLLMVGFVLILIGVGLGLIFFDSFRKAGTRVEPWKPTDQIVTTGIYAHTRNPAYLSFCIIIIGLGFVYNSLWILLSFIPAAYLIWLLVIKKEEAYLEAKFGEEYLSYKKRVRRWI